VVVVVVSGTPSEAVVDVAPVVVDARVVVGGLVATVDVVVEVDAGVGVVVVVAGGCVVVVAGGCVVDVVAGGCVVVVVVGGCVVVVGGGEVVVVTGGGAVVVVVVAGALARWRKTWVVHITEDPSM
jgi:hypothetical protein